MRQSISYRTYGQSASLQGAEAEMQGMRDMRQVENGVTWSFLACTSLKSALRYIPPTGSLAFVGGMGGWQRSTSWR